MPQRSQVADLLVEKYGVERDAIALEASLQDLGLDSLSIAELVFDIEDLFEIEIDAEEADFTTYGGALEMLSRHVDFDDE